MTEELPVYAPDADIGNADWTKKTWDLPPYKSAEFLELIGGVDALDDFRLLPVYEYAVERGLIHDEEWVADWLVGWTGF